MLSKPGILSGFLNLFNKFKYEHIYNILYIQVLPLLTLNQYFSTFVCRDLQRTVDGRILKTRVLADLGLFTEAFIVLQRLLHGERLPHTGDSSFRQVESKIASFKFDTSKPITEPVNLKVGGTFLAYHSFTKYTNFEFTIVSQNIPT